MIDRPRIAIVLGVIGLIGAVFMAGKRYLGNELSPLGVGDEAPNFKAATLDSASRVKTLAEYKGNVVMINIWATWCKPCVVEMPSIEQLHQAYAPRGLKIIAISVDDPGTDEQIRAFVKRYGLTFEILHDQGGQAGPVSKMYDATRYPETVIIGRDGIIRKKFSGATDWNSPVNRALIERLLEENTEAD
ncbi:MAG: TlpA family protein disulfide reductase [Gemmatimonadota bacterium]|nr:TlpA family protein disulfide reductase [Gemmatimonadota bacterium]